MLRTHDVVLADGTFRIVMTPKQRIVAALEVHESPLGPLHLAFEVDRAPYLPPHVPPYVLTPGIETAGIFGDIGHAISKAAEGTFNAASKVATTVARPVFDVAKGAAAEGAHLIAHTTPFLPAAARKQIDNAAHVVMKARLGDVTAKQFIKTIGTAAKAGVKAAQHVGDALLDASKLVAKAVDVPVIIASHIPGAGGIVKSLSPLERFQHMVTNVQKGDFKALEKMVKEDISMAQGVISLFPGIGTGISAALSAGMAALEGGNPIEVAIKLAYGAIPIPPGIRQITDTVLDTVLAFLEHPHDLTEVAIQVARDKVPAGLPRDVFDTLVHLVIKHVPIQKVAVDLVEHYVSQYAPQFAGQKLDDALKGLHVDPGAILEHVANLPHVPNVANVAQAVPHLANIAHAVPHAASLVHAVPHVASIAHALPHLASPAHAPAPPKAPVRLLQPLHTLGHR